MLMSAPWARSCRTTSTAPTLAAVIGADVVPRREVGAVGLQHDDPNVVVGGALCERIVELVQERRMLRVAGFGAVEGNDGDGALGLVLDELLFGHEIS